MPAARTALLLILLVLTAAQGRAQTTPPDPAAVRSGMAQILSLATFGAITVPDQAVEVTQDGADYRVRLPLSGFSAPPDAAILAVAHAIEHGLLDITSMTFPATGTIEPTPRGGALGRVTYAIGQQTITGKVDPRLATLSSYEGAFGQVRLTTENGDRHSEQIFDKYTFNGSISSEADGLVTMASQGSGTGFHLTGHGPADFVSEATVRAAAGHFAVEGLNRAQGERLMAAFRAATVLPDTPDSATGVVPKRRDGPAVPGEHDTLVSPEQRDVPVLPERRDAPDAPGEHDALVSPERRDALVSPEQRDALVSPERRDALRAMVDAAGGLLKRLEAEEIIEDLHYDFGASAGTTSGTISRVRLNMAGEAKDQRLNSELGIAVEGIKSASLGAETAAFVPHHVDLKTVLRGVPTDLLMALLRAATAADADPAELQAQVMGLLADPRTQIAIEALSFDSGPLRIEGTAKLVPRANGQPGAEVHISAMGVDTLLAQAQSEPDLQGILPMMFLAKGMGKPVGESLVWDISLGGGPITVNGTRLGQPGGKTR